MDAERTALAIEALRKILAAAKSAGVVEEYARTPNMPGTFNVWIPGEFDPLQLSWRNR